MSRIDGVLFDLGETLLDYGNVSVREVFRLGAERAYEYLQSLGQPLPSLSRFHRGLLWAIRWRCVAGRIRHREFNSAGVLANASREMGQTLSDEQLHELAWCFYEPLGRRARVADGTRETLEALRSSGIKTGIVSNTFIAGDILDRHLSEVGLLELLEPRVYSSHELYRKPDRRIFAEALSRAGLQAERTLFVGDRPRVDIWGANRMGMISVLRDIGRYRWRVRFWRRGRPRHVIREIRELTAIVAKYNS